MAFVPALELSRLLCEELIAPLVAERYPGLACAAATLGMCSEVLGLDDEVSTDHEWGPRLRVFLSEQDHARCSSELAALFGRQLPATFKGFRMAWRTPGVDLHDTRETILYHVSVGTVSQALGFCGGTAALPLGPADWLEVSEQQLLEFTAGTVYHDGTGELTKARELLAYYPDDVLRFLSMGEWNAVGADWSLVGRIGSRGDRLGLRLEATRIVERLMRIAFMVSRRYFPYRKWFGTLFRRLPVAPALEPLLLELLAEPQWQKVEEQLGTAAGVLLGKQNELGLTPPIALEAITAEDGRHHIVYDFGKVGHELADGLPVALGALMRNQLAWREGRSLILWNGETGKWPLLLQKGDRKGDRKGDQK